MSTDPLPGFYTLHGPQWPPCLPQFSSVRAPCWSSSRTRVGLYSHHSLPLLSLYSPSTPRLLPVYSPSTPRHPCKHQGSCPCRGAEARGHRQCSLSGSGPGGAEEVHSLGPSLQDQRQDCLGQVLVLQQRYCDCCHVGESVPKQFLFTQLISSGLNRWNSSRNLDFVGIYERPWAPMGT